MDLRLTEVASASSSSDGAKIDNFQAVLGSDTGLGGQGESFQAVLGSDIGLDDQADIDVP